MSPSLSRAPLEPIFNGLVQVSFTSEFTEDPQVLVPSWFGNGCDVCIEFSSGFPRGEGAYVNVSREELMGDWEEQAVLQATDRRNGDRFGSNVALDQVRYQRLCVLVCGVMCNAWRLKIWKAYGP